jgi:hypothetical protein
MKKVILLAILCVGIWAASEFDKEILLQECIDNTEGTDADCEECYFKVYGERPC